MNTATGLVGRVAEGTTERSVVPDVAESDIAAIEVVGAGKAFGANEVLRDVDLRVEPGSVVALLGPSGCGKTTLLRSIAGLERLDAGEIRLGGKAVSRARQNFGGAPVHLPPEKRKVGMVFQDWALFPHLSVAQNVAYGLPRAERKGPRVADVLALVDLAGLGDRQPGTLSGGQQQRVALARALAPRPKLLLLDEPFSNLDTALRVQVRAEVHQLLAELGITTVFVTHDQEEAFVLGDEVAVMQGGRVVQQATPSQLYARPASPWVASFVGDANLVAGQAHGNGSASTAVGPVPLEEPADGPVKLVIRPEELRLDPPPDHRSAEDAAATTEGLATVELREYYGHDTVFRVRLDRSDPAAAGTELLRIRVGSTPRFGRGDRVVVRYAGPPAIAFPVTSEPAASS